jgi:glucose/arabinose dehydrogenase/plastocyanin
MTLDRRAFLLSALLVCGLAGLLALNAPAQAQFAAADNMNPMEHGPFVSSTITLDPFSDRGIITYKGIAVRVAPDAAMVFDTDLLRVVGAWTGGILHWLPARDGLQEWPLPDGHLHFLNAEKAGWSTSTNLNDPRSGSPSLKNARRYGPIGGDRRYEGLHVHGDEVVFSLSVADAKIREKFGFQRVRGEPVFTRTINVSPTDAALTLLVVPAPVGQASRLEQTRVISGSGYVSVHSGGEARLIGFRGLPDGVEWHLENGHLALSLPALDGDLHFQLSIGPLRPGRDTRYMRAHLRASAGSLDLLHLLDPGPARYPAVETQARVGVSEYGPFTVDELVLPRDNPWRSHLRLSAIDFLSDGRAVIASMSGDIWLVDGIQENLSTLRWQRFATGLNQPLGLVVVDDVIYVNGRDQITRLHDLNGNGHADHYENFNNEVMAASNYHAFNLNLEVDSQGRFLWAKSTPWPAASPVPGGGWQTMRSDLSDAAEITPHHGVLFRLSPDGRELEIVATGLRNPNGLSIGPNDEIYYADNEGNWVPTSKVTRIVEGGFHGFVPSAHRMTFVDGWAPTDDWVKPLIWTPHAGPGADNSPSQPRVIVNDAWPAELQSHLLLASYGRGTLALVLLEEVEGQPQGAHLVLPLEFQSGLQHMRFHRDGHLYLVGMTNWSSASHGGERGSLHRVRYTGKPLHLPVAVNTREGGLELRFGEPLDHASATDRENYRLSKWTYTWNSSYGSRQFSSLDRPGEGGADPVAVRSVRLSEDGRTVLLEIPALVPGPIPAIPITGDLPHQVEASLGMVMQIDYDIRATDGTRLDQLIHKTIHRVPGAVATPEHVHPEPVTPAPTAAPERRVHAEARTGQITRGETGRVVAVRSRGTELSFYPAHLQATAGETLTIRYENTSDMIHNLVLVRSEADIPIIGEASFQAAFTNQWIPTGEEHANRMIAHTELAGPADVVEVTFTVPPPGEYPFICTYASHWTVMRGTLVVSE